MAFEADAWLERHMEKGGRIGEEWEGMKEQEEEGKG